MTCTLSTKRFLVCSTVFLLVAVPLKPGIAFASQEFAHPDHVLTITVPDGWERRLGLAEPILITAVKRGSGDSLGLLGFKAPNDKFTLNRKAAETGVRDELGAKGKILRRVDTKLAGVSAYCVVAEMEYQGQKISLARIMAEKPINGFVYAVQYSKIGGGDLDDAFIKWIVDCVRLKKHK